MNDKKYYSPFDSAIKEWKEDETYDADKDWQEEQNRPISGMQTQLKTWKMSTTDSKIKKFYENEKNATFKLTVITQIWKTSVPNDNISYTCNEMRCIVFYWSWSIKIPFASER